MNYDIVICYRVYPGVSKTPVIFPQDKRKLVHLCLVSLAQALSGVKAKMIVLFDRCPPEYQTLFEDVLQNVDWEAQHVTNGGNAATFQMQCEILSEQEDSEYILFLEDDYFFLPDAINKIIIALNRPEVDFVTPFNHPGYETMKLHDYPREIIQIDDEFGLMRVASSTLTFGAKVSLLKKNYSIFLSYTRGNWDSSLWMAITRLGAFRWNIFGHYLARTHLGFIRIYLKLYRYGLQRLTKKPDKLYAIRPSVATHMEKTDVSKDRDWEKHFEAIRKARQIPQEHP